jgi:hypothetical protein
MDDLKSMQERIFKHVQMIQLPLRQMAEQVMFGITA